MVNKSQPGKQRILIVGGIAGGASCAARARRLSESSEIIIFERGPNVSLATCGLPYFVGNVIKDEKDLLVATPELFKNQLNIDVRLQHDVLSIDRQKKEITVRNNTTREQTKERYDSLVLCTGTTPFRPPLQGIDLPGIFVLRNLNDGNQIREMIEKRNARKAVLVGAGAIGLESVENIVNRGLEVTLIDMLPQVMPALDPEMAFPLHEYLVSNGVKLQLGDKVAKFEGNAQSGVKTVVTESGVRLPADLVILGMGVRPDIKLAKEAGLEIGKLGGIRVDDQMRTSDKNIWAVGDVTEAEDFITKEWTLLAMAGPSSREGRIAADVICGRNSHFRGVQGTVVVKVFEVTAAATGLSEKALKNNGFKYEKVYVIRGHHAGYYPGAKTIALKIIFSSRDGRILGAQAVGMEGVEKRIDVISMAIQRNSTVYDLEEAELCYSPQFGSAKDQVDIAGMAAANFLRGDSPVIHWPDVGGNTTYLLDVREPVEYKQGHADGSVNIPLSTLRSRLDEIPREKEIQVYCATGQRSYYATRILLQNGFQAKNISGGWRGHKAITEMIGKSPKKVSKFILETVA